MISLQCPQCRSTLDCTDLESAIHLSLGGVAATPLVREFLAALISKGPLLLSQINAMDWEHLGSRDGAATPVYIRQLQARMNTATVTCPDIAVLSSQRADVGGSKTDPIAFLFFAPKSQWRGLKGAEPHVKLSDLIMM